MVEDEIGIEAAPLEMRLEVKVLGGGSARSARQTYHLTSLNLVAYLDEIARLVRIKRFQAVAVADDDAVAVAVVRT